MREELERLVTMISGHDTRRRTALLRLHSGFENAAGERIEAESIGQMSDKWVSVTVDRIKAALKDGAEIALYDENGVKRQLGLFK